MYFVVIVYLFTLVFVGFVVVGGGFVIFFFFLGEEEAMELSIK